MLIDHILDAVICHLSNLGWLLICLVIFVAYVSLCTCCALIGTMKTYKFDLLGDVLPTTFWYLHAPHRCYLLFIITMPPKKTSVATSKASTNTP
jgi:uncharacterized membrane protein